MFRKRLCTILAIFALSVGVAVAAEQTAPCTRPLKHLDCTDLKNLEKVKNCEVPKDVQACPDPIVCPEPVVCDPPADPILVPVPYEVQVPVEVKVPVPVCAACDFVKQWNIQVVGGENKFRGLQGRFKNFGIRAGEYDRTQEATLASTVTTEVAAETQSSRSDDDHKTTICHKKKVTITVDNSALPAHFAHGDTVGACTDTEPPPTCGGCDDGICREECPQNCEQPPTCDDGVCREECPQNCNTEPPQINTVRRIENGRAFTVEGLYFIPLPNKCSNFSLYVGAGLTRRTEIGIVQEIETGKILERDSNNRYRGTGTIGAEYRLPFSMVVGTTYDTSFGLGVTVGYSYRFKNK
jgi:hypothetical protein